MKSDDFFNAEKFPKITFKSTGIQKKSGDEYVLHGDLTIRDVTKNIALNVEYNGQTVDSYGQHKCGFELTGKISRKEFGLKWNVLTDTGGVVAGDEVKIHCNVQFIRQK